MNLKWIANIILFLLLLCNVLILWIFHEPKKKFIIDINDKFNQQYFYENYKASVLSNKIIANDSEVFFGIDSLESFNISKLITTDILVFRFSGNFCNGCNEFVINKLKEHFDNFYKNDKIVFLGKNLSPRLKDNYFGKKVLSYKRDNLGLPFEESDFPVMFVLDENKLVKMVFLPDRTFPGYFDSYLKYIKESGIGEYELHD